MHPRKRTKPPPAKVQTAYRQLWRVVDGAVADALAQHPEYLAQGIVHKVVRASINKRVVGGLLSFLSDREGPDGDNAG